MKLRLRRADRASEDASDLFVLTAFYINQSQCGHLIPFGSSGVRKNASATPLAATDSVHQKKKNKRFILTLFSKCSIFLAKLEVGFMLPALLLNYWFNIAVSLGGFGIPCRSGVHDLCGARQKLSFAEQEMP
ncbi:MAG: hypothetical protein KF762_12470 [Acidobacteria bacterium]|nr:hypothetical protein [Acidobacteriota bacterium]